MLGGRACNMIYSFKIQENKLHLGCFLTDLFRAFGFQTIVREMMVQCNALIENYVQ